MKKRANLTAKVKIDKAKTICELYSKGEYTISSCCKAVEVKYETFKQWTQPNLTEEDITLGNYRPGFIPAIHFLYKKALETNKVNYKALLEDAAREGLLKRANGISYVETHTQAKFDVNGNSIGAIINKIEKYLPPDVTVLIFLANCLALFDRRDESNREFISALKNKYKHLTIEELQAKRLELERKLAN